MIRKRTECNISPIFVAGKYGQSQRMDRRPLAKKSVTLPR